MEVSNRIKAEIIADSINEQGDRITTYILTFPRIVLAEFNTHRAISKNSASSRAIPFATMVQKVKLEPFIPIAFQKDHKGMQGTEYLEGDELRDATAEWILGSQAAIYHASNLSTLSKVTKQLCNRMLEPYLYHTVICTGTEWENFFALRAHPDAEIHIADLAEKMLVAYNESAPKLLEAGQWHIPFGGQFDSARIGVMQRELGIPFDVVKTEGGVDFVDLSESKVKIATARCARVSYLNFEGKDDYVADIRLYNQLLASGHMSPFEHCARAMTPEEYVKHFSGIIPDMSSLTSIDESQIHGSREEAERLGQELLTQGAFGRSGNFKGFIQHRKMLSGENKLDPRVIKK